MRFRSFSLFCILLTSLSCAANAGVDSNADLLRACVNVAKSPDFVPKDYDESFQSGYCLGMVQGLVYGTSVARRPFCLPDSWNIGLGVETFVKWAESHADKADAPATDGIMASHILAFPCKKAD